MEIGKAIYSLLTGATAVTDICASRIYPERADVNADQPYIAYTVTNQAPTATKASTSTLDVAEVEVYCVAKDYAVAIDLGVAVRDTLDRNGGTIAGVEVQAINFQGADVDFIDEREIYVTAQRYTVRIQRVGQAPAVTLVGTNNTLTIQEVDGSPQSVVTTIEVPNGTLTIDGVVATLDYAEAADFRYLATRWQWIRASMSAAVLSGGASQEDYNSATPRTMSFDTNDDQVGVDLAFSTVNHDVTIGETAYYRVTVCVVFSSATNKTQPHIALAIDGVQEAGGAHAFIDNSNGSDLASATLIITQRFAAGDVLTVECSDASTISGSIFATSSIWEVERVH
jgi:hypothetical protein